MRVLVLGAGMAGLSAAYELRNAGYHVTVLEYNGRAGGRSWSIRGGDRYTELGGAEQACRFAKGEYVNPGPWRLPYHHNAMLDYARRLNVPLEPFIQVNYNAYLHSTTAFGGKPQRYRTVQADYNGHVAELLAKATNAGRLDGALGRFVRQRHHLGRRQVLQSMVAPHLAPAPRARQAVVQPHHVPRDGMPRRAAPGVLALHVADHALFDLLPRQGRCLFAIEALVPAGQPPRMVIRLASDHRAVQFAQLRLEPAQDRALTTHRFRNQLANLLQMNMTRHKLRIRIDHRNQRLVEVVVAQAGGAPECAGAGHVAASKSGL